ncbi:MAG: aldo/keto reductase [Cyclobacteriaceae bacterium]
MEILMNETDLQQKRVRDCAIPTIGLGTHDLKGYACLEAVVDAITLGYRHIDTAQAYGNEAAVGAGLIASGISREEVFITDKIWWDKLAPDALQKSLDRSLNELQTNYIDLLLIHWPSPDDVPLRDSLQAMYELKRSGKVKFIGVSNFNTSLMKSALTYEDIVCNQIEYHPFLAQQEMIDLALDHSFFVIAYSPLAQGEVLEDDTLIGLGIKYGKSASQIALRWLIQQHLVVAIPRSSSQEHREANIDIFDFELSEVEMSEISKMGDREQRLIDPEFAPAWD